MIYNVNGQLAIHKDIDIDETIYHFLKEKHLPEILDDKTFFLCYVLNWEDRWENPARFFRIQNDSQLSGSIQTAQYFQNSFYASCWSRSPETDELWRIYSPDKKAVRIKTTFRKLLRSTYLCPTAGIDGFIAPVRYSDSAALSSDVSLYFDEEAAHYVPYYKSVFLKRNIFSYENEVRFAICDFGNMIKLEGSSYVESISAQGLNLKLQNYNFIEEISFDPRLKKEDFIKLENKYSQYGVPLRKADYYELPGMDSNKKKSTDDFSSTCPESCKIWGYDCS